MSQEHPIIMILGWRSGSSSLSKELYEKGYPLTPPLDLRPMEGHQPEGHYENVEVQQINEALLVHFQMNVFTPGILPFVNADVVENWLGEHPEPVIAKDPRFAFTWPVWKTSTRRRIVFVWTNRDKETQVGSIIRWYKIPQDGAKACVAMHDMGAQLACERHESAEVDVKDSQRVEKVEAFLRRFVQPALE